MVCRSSLQIFSRKISITVEPLPTFYSIYDEIADIIARLKPKKILALRASKDMQQRFELLVDKLKKSEISRQEKDELDHFIVLERLFRLAKIRADHPPKG